MLNDFMNGLEVFKEECNSLSEEEFMAPFLELGIEFIPIKETKTQLLSSSRIQRHVVFNVELEEKSQVRRQLIA